MNMGVENYVWYRSNFYFLVESTFEHYPEVIGIMVVYVRPS
jgi:hypothetical protein